MNNSALELISTHRLVAIVRLNDLSRAVELSRSLLLGGILAQEYTLTNPESLSAIEKVREAIPEFDNGTACIGVGSVRSPEQVIAAHRSGAQFIVAPNTDEDVANASTSVGLPWMPGAMTPTEIARAWKLGAAVVKVFPVRGLGPNYISDVLAPMPDIKLMPTGGVDLTNMAGYLSAGAVAVGIGVNALGKQAIENGDWDRVTEVAVQCARTARGQ